MVGVGAAIGSLATVCFLALHIPTALSIGLGAALAVIVVHGLAER